MEFRKLGGIDTKIAGGKSGFDTLSSEMMTSDAAVKQATGVTSYTTRGEAEEAMARRAKELGGLKGTGLHIKELPDGSFTYWHR